MADGSRRTRATARAGATGPTACIGHGVPHNRRTPALCPVTQTHPKKVQDNPGLAPCSGVARVLRKSWFRGRYLPASSGPAHPAWARSAPSRRGAASCCASPSASPRGRGWGGKHRSHRLSAPLSGHLGSLRTAAKRQGGGCGDPEGLQGVASAPWCPPGNLPVPSRYSPGTSRYPRYPLVPSRYLPVPSR